MRRPRAAAGRALVRPRRVAPAAQARSVRPHRHGHTGASLVRLPPHPQIDRMATLRPRPTEKPDPDVLLAQAAKQYEVYVELAKLADLTKALSPQVPALPSNDTPLSFTIWPTR